MTTTLEKLRSLAESLNSPQSKRRDTMAGVLYEARREVAAILDDLEWRDISTALRDGTKIDLLFAYPRGRQNDCQWRQGDVYGDGGWYWSIPQWGSQPGLGIDWHLLPEDEWETGCYPNMEPTHWKPLPEPPALAVKTDGGRT